MLTLAVAGATGVVGHHVAEVARERGHRVVPLARSLGVDLLGEAGRPGLTELLRGVDAVVDTTNVQTQSQRVAEAHFGAITRNLLAAEAAAGVGHHVLLSIVGVEDVPTGYYRAKVAQERQVAAGGVGWSVLRATQFHEFAEQVLGFVRVGPVSVVPRMTSQPVAAVEVAQALVDLAEGAPCGQAPDLAGPERLPMHDLARRVSRSRGLGRRVVAVPLPGAAGRRMRDGTLCPTGAGPRGTVTFDAWLAAA